MSALTAVTWESEIKKPMTGTDWQKAEASAIRCFEAAVTLAERNIVDGVEPLQELDRIRGWLARCLFSCNLNNFK